MRRALPILLAVSAFVVAHTTPAHAQSKVGTATGQFLLIEPSARLAGMGNAGSTAHDEILAAYYNPAAIGYFKTRGAQFTHALWFADISYDHAAVALPLGGLGSLYASLTSLNSGDIAVRTVGQPLGTGELYRVSDVSFSVGYGRLITDLFSLGVQMHYLQESIFNTSARTFAMSAGTLYRLSDQGLEIGSSLNYFGTSSRFSGRDLAILYDADPDEYGDNGNLPADQTTGRFPVPVLFRVGIGLPVRLTPAQKLRLAIDAYHPSDDTESISLGGEWAYRDVVALRTGYQNLFQQDSELGLTFGAGFQSRVGDYKVRADYAWADHRRLDATHRITVGVNY
ncbi:MAG: PorV/PorQ family protein [Candidatus Eisenbacteria bacterium]|uniref:PorV/PorQ family protein n=1 Tax=Eiseniibacteriota bacterium TaxID=2212470 RepID=A0A849SG31_UNCEI|nr:PorV/PorQ family protein [Candidatus Eisenbacteria bacterium]